LKNMITKILRKVYFFDLSMLISLIVIDYDYYNVLGTPSRRKAAKRLQSCYVQLTRIPLFYLYYISYLIFLNCFYYYTN
jgi:hypothetical protein